MDQIGLGSPYAASADQHLGSSDPEVSASGIAGDSRHLPLHQAGTLFVKSILLGESRSDSLTYCLWLLLVGLHGGDRKSVVPQSLKYLSSNPFQEVWHLPVTASIIFLKIINENTHSPGLLEKCCTFSSTHQPCVFTFVSSKSASCILVILGYFVP